MQTNYEINRLKEISDMIQELIDALEAQKRKVDRKIVLKGVLEKMKNE